MIITRKEAEEFTKIHVDTLTVMIKYGVLTNYGVDGPPKFDTEELERVMVELHLVETYRDMPQEFKDFEEHAIYGESE